MCMAWFLTYLYLYTSRWDSDFTVADSVITNIPVEYTGATAIFLGYVQSTTIEHNHMENMTYSAMTVSHLPNMNMAGFVRVDTHTHTHTHTHACLHANAISFDIIYDDVFARLSSQHQHFTTTALLHLYIR